MLPVVQQILAHAHQRQHLPAAQAIVCLFVQVVEPALLLKDSMDQAVDSSFLSNSGLAIQDWNLFLAVVAAQMQSSRDIAKSREKVGAPVVLEKGMLLSDFCQLVLHQNLLPDCVLHYSVAVQTHCPAFPAQVHVQDQQERQEV